jgi:hypothetical protein
MAVPAPWHTKVGFAGEYLGQRVLGIADLPLEQLDSGGRDFYLECHSQHN